MKKTLAIIALASAFGAASASAEGVQKSSLSGGCENWSLSATDLKSCNEQMSLARTESERMAVMNRFKKGTNTSGVDAAATTGTSADRDNSGPAVAPGGVSNPASESKTPGGASNTR
jgi:hypothetical protein